jgi:hypothetical protein
MELINRYAAEVGRHLPEKGRPDIEQELRSILEDMLDDRARAAGKPADEEMAAALLKEYGEPGKVASTYHAPRYLVGPAVYPTFVMVMKIVLTVIAVLAVIQFGFSAARGGATPVQIGGAFAQSFSTFFNGGLTALGIVTLIFALNERFNPNLKFDKQEWNPRELRPVPQSASRVKTGDLIASIVFNLIAIVVFNLYFDRIGFYTNTNGTWTMIPIFSEVLRGYVIYFTFLWGLEVGLHVYVLQAGTWDLTTRWLAIGHALASIVLLGVILNGPSIAAPAQQLVAAWQEAGMDALQMTDLQGALDLGVRSIIAVVLIVEIVEMGQQAWGLIQRREV